jgi:putative GTP pyrophosphokinase
MAEATDRLEDQQKWLIEALPKHERLAAAVKSLLENMLKKKKIDYLAVTARVKTLDGVIEKIKRKEYDDPETQLTDVSGIRIITYLEEQVGQISKIIKDLFYIDKTNSLDRAEVLGDDRVGYRSTHFVCTLGKKRDKLPEYESLGPLKFEIQVRTVLQHAWAELAHDRSFKFGVALPTKIQRKLNLYSGMLEIADSAFDEISREIDVYKRYIQKHATSQISNAEVDSISLTKFISELSAELGIEVGAPAGSEVYSEMKRFGISTIGDLRNLVTADFVKHFKVIAKENSTTTGLIRRIMSYHDLDRYLNLKPSFGSVTRATITLLQQKYDSKHIESAYKTAGIRIKALAKSHSASGPPA